MPSKDPVQRFEDILENIVLIEEFTKGMNANSFLEDLKTRNATERCIERISEAARKPGELAGTLSNDSMVESARLRKSLTARIRQS